jgi:hypothetical protein
MESKIQLCERLRAENRWPEASLWKDAKVKELRAAGMPKAEAGEKAWEQMALEFPPVTDTNQPTTEAPDTTAGKGPPWRDLPDSSDINEDRLWAYNWAPLCIDRTATGTNKINWHLASRPPSKGALMQMQAAASSPNTFIDAVNKGAKQEGPEDDENRRRERKSIAEIEKILAGYDVPPVTCPKCGHSFDGGGR